VESLSIIRFFRMDAGGYSGICRLKPKPGKRIASLVGAFGMTRIDPLSREADDSYIAYVEGRPKGHWSMIGSSREGFQSPPFELTPRAWRKTLVGSEAQLRRALKGLERAGLRFRVVWAGEAKFGSLSLIASLTEGQARTLSAAFRAGYFDVPRKIGSRGLARKLGLSKAAVSEQLRRAERSVFDQIFAESPDSLPE
jgi:hypothetical protein